MAQASSQSSPHAAIAAALAETTRRQSEAADPQASVWVSANAGTGKTHVLTQRVLRLLLTGIAPERILCLTYTKAAAAEMSTRVFDTLAGWVGLPDAALDATLEKLTGQAPAGTERALARTLFTRAIETPGGFKVQTIHAFCERLLQRFPLEAGVAPGFSILDDAQGRALIREAIDETLSEATRDRSSPLGQALTTAIRYAAEDQFDTVLTDAIARRDLLDAVIRRGAAEADGADPLDLARSLLQAGFSVRAGATATQLRAGMAGVLDTPTLGRLRDALAVGTKTDMELAAGLAAAQRVDGDAR
jgi:ATP-dependent helicase/nuclease subunit A